MYILDILFNFKELIKAYFYGGLKDIKREERRNFSINNAWLTIDDYSSAAHLMVGIGY